MVSVVSLRPGFLMASVAALRLALRASSTQLLGFLMASVAALRLALRASSTQLLGFAFVGLLLD